MLRRTGRNSGNGQFIPVAQAKAMGDRATVETIQTEEVTERMIDAGVVVCRLFAARPDEPTEGEGREFVRELYEAMRKARVS